MVNQQLFLDVIAKRAKKAADRRQFLRKTGGVALGMAGGMVLGACGDSMSSAMAQSGPTDVEILNFALNLEYLEAQFYHYAVFGTGLDASLLTGLGAQGTISGGTQVNFTDPLVAQ